MLRRSRSRSQQQKDLSSPGRRRVTRSQTRDVDDSVSAQGFSSRARKDTRTTQGLNKGLAPVVEESPRKTPQTASSRHASTVIPESPEDATNISGTTYLPEPETRLELDMVVESLPDLQRTGKSVLDFLAPETPNPVAILQKLKQLTDPKETQSRRLRRQRANLERDMTFFGNDVYIDVQDVRSEMSPAFAARGGDFARWTPDPILHLANCARFAEQILLAGSNRHQQRQALRTVEGLFPLPFMSGLVDSEQPKGPGESSLEDYTLDLALEIRTQSLLFHLEENQGNPDFKPKNAVKLWFFTGLSNSSPARGFNLPNFGGPDGALPDHYKSTVRRICNKILVSQDEEDPELLDLNELRGARLWKHFIVQAAQWVRERTKEIKRDLQHHQSAQAISDAFFDSKLPSFGSRAEGEEEEPNAKMGGEEEEVPQEEDAEPAQGEVVEPETTALPEPPQEPEPRAIEKDTERRQSSKPAYLNSSSFRALAQRRERLLAGTTETAETSDNRRQSDIVRPVSRVENDSDANRRQTLPSRAQEATARQDSRSFDEGSRHEETYVPEITVDDDTPFGLGDESTQIERSHSPPTVRRSAASQRSEPSSSAPKTNRMSQIRRVMETVGPGTFSQRTADPRRTDAARFIDRQRNAERVSPISQSGSQTAVRRVEERTSRKRARADSDSNDDDEFDSDDRSLDLERRRAEKPQNSRNKRARREEPEREPASTQTRDDDDDYDDDLEEPEPEPERAPASQRSRQRSGRRSQPASIRSTTTKKTTGRRFWTEAEDNRLKRLMQELGTSWSDIEKQNDCQSERAGEERLVGRDQVALKDRARNLKIRAIRDTNSCPRFLRYVPLKSLDIERLENQGIDVRRVLGLE